MKALIIYDDLTGATRATAALKRAALRANVGADWDIKPWRTDALKFPSVADRALIEAADADLIVLAGPQAHSLPTWLEDWLRCWVIRRNIEDAADQSLSAPHAQSARSGPEFPTSETAVPVLILASHRDLGISN